MTYRTEKDENGNEALFMTAIVHDNIVDLDWPHEKDDAETYSQRCLARLTTRVTADTHSFPPKSAVLTMRLYRRGDAMLTNIACGEDYRDEAIRLAEEAALGIYDEVFPEVAKLAREFVLENVESTMLVAADSQLSVLTVEEGEEISPDEFLPRLLCLAKANLEETGEVAHQIGWLVNNRMALFPFPMPPLEKYRYFRAVAEVARRTNADAVVHISDAYELTADSERTGREILMVSWVNPDGTCTNTAAGYTRRKHPQLKRDIITFSPDALDAQGMTQILVPAWGSYRTN
jgi:hypothetical protein